MKGSTLFWAVTIIVCLVLVDIRAYQKCKTIDQDYVELWYIINIVAIVFYEVGAALFREEDQWAKISIIHGFGILL